MFGLLFLLLIAVPVLELYVIVQVGQSIGVLETLAVLVAISVAGAWLLRQQGMATWRRLQATLQRGEMPTREVTDGALILLGGALLLTPGFLTDVVGLVFLIPPTRALVKGAARRLLGRMAARRFGVAASGGRRVYEARVTNVRRSERHDDGTGPRSTSSPVTPPLSSGHRGAEGGSPGTG